MEFLVFLIVIILISIIAGKIIFKMPNPGERLYQEEHKDEYDLYNKKEHEDWRI